LPLDTLKLYTVYEFNYHPPMSCPMKMRISRTWLHLLPILAFVALPGCVSVKTEHRVEPIHITMDVNVRLERALDDAFAELDAQSVAIAEQKGIK